MPRRELVEPALARGGRASSALPAAGVATQAARPAGADAVGHVDAIPPRILARRLGRDLRGASVSGKCARDAHVLGRRRARQLRLALLAAQAAPIERGDPGPAQPVPRSLGDGRLLGACSRWSIGPWLWRCGSLFEIRRGRDDRPRRTLRSTTRRGESPWLVFAAGMGWALVVFSGRGSNLFQDDLLPRWLILGFAWLLAARLAGAALAAFADARGRLRRGGCGGGRQPVWRRAGLASRRSRSVLWSLVALGLNIARTAPAGAPDGRGPAAGVRCLGAMGAAVVGTFVGFTVPFWKSEAAIARAEN